MGFIPFNTTTTDPAVLDLVPVSAENDLLFIDVMVGANTSALQEIGGSTSLDFLVEAEPRASP